MDSITLLVRGPTLGKPPCATQSWAALSFPPVVLGLCLFLSVSPYLSLSTSPLCVWGCLSVSASFSVSPSQKKEGRKTKIDVLHRACPHKPQFPQPKDVSLDAMFPLMLFFSTSSEFGS